MQRWLPPLGLAGMQKKKGKRALDYVYDCSKGEVGKRDFIFPLAGTTWLLQVSKGWPLLAWLKGLDSQGLPVCTALNISQRQSLGKRAVRTIITAAQLGYRSCF